MTILNSKIHGIVDYVVVLFLLASPTLFHLPDITTLFTYSLACIHLGLTISTQYEMGIMKVIPLPVHGWIELVVSISLIGVAFFLGDIEGEWSRYFYLAFGTAVFVTWLATDYKSTPTK